MPDLDKSSGKNMLFEPSEEFLMSKQHLLCFGAVRIVLVAEPDMGWIYLKYPVSGDGDFVGTCLPEGRCRPRYSTTWAGEPNGAFA